MKSNSHQNNVPTNAAAKQSLLSHIIPKLPDEDPKASFEEILDVLGHFGRYQIRLFIITSLLDFAASLTMVFYIFSNVVPPWTCVPMNSSYNSTLSVVGSNRSDYFQTCDNNESLCEYKYDVSNTMWSIVSEWDLICDMHYVPKLSVSIQMAGVFVGALCAGYLADWKGRKFTLVVYCISLMILQTAVGLSVNWYMFIVLRCLVGFFIAGPFCICFTLPMEFIGPKWRTFAASLNLFGLSTMALALISYLTRNWRYLSLATGLMFLPVIPALVKWVPESVRWQAMKGRFDEAEQTIILMARFNNTSVPNLRKLRDLAEQDKNEQREAKRHSYLDLFISKSLATYALTMMFCSFTCSAVFYGISTMYSTFEGSIFTNAVLAACVAMPFGWSVIYFGHRFGRRKAFFGYMTVTIACMFAVLIIGLLHKREELGILMTVLVIFGEGAIIAGWNLVGLFGVEIYPTVIRNIGIGATSTFSRIGGILAPQIAYLGIVVHWVLPYGIYLVLCVVSIVLVFLVLPETNKKPLKDAITEQMPETTTPNRVSISFHLEPIQEEEDYSSSDI